MLCARELRAVKRLLDGPVWREELDKVIPSSNGPDVIFRLRAKGFTVPCQRVRVLNRFGEPCYPGRYYFTENDERLAMELLSRPSRETWGSQNEKQQGNYNEKSDDAHGFNHSGW